MTRADLTEKLLDIKREKGWSWKQICSEIGGMSPVLITAARPNEIDQAASREGGRIVRLEQERAGFAQRGAASRRADAADRSADLSVLRTGDGQRLGAESADRGGIRRR